MVHQNKLKKFYNIVLSQTFSESGEYLFVGNRNGDIFVIKVDDLDRSSDDEPQQKDPKIYSQGEGVDINSLCFRQDTLIVGSVGIIYGIQWDEEKGTLASQRKWTVNIRMNAVEVPDINTMWLRPGSNILYAGCGDNNVYGISLEDGQVISEFRGHTDYVHCVTGGTDRVIYSASEDGTVRSWCERQKDCTGVIEPAKRLELMRPELGKWIGSVAVNSDWLICGGGPKLSIWHLSTMDCMQDFPFPGKVHVCDFVEENIVVGGEHSHVQMYAFNGELQANIPVENTATYSIAHKLEPGKLMTIGGYSNKLHVLKDFRFLDSKIELYKDAEKLEDKIMYF